MVSLKDIVPAALNNITTQFILLEKGTTTLEGQHKTCLALVADETAAVHFQLWGTECDSFEPGDIIRLTNGIFSYNRNNLVLRAGKRGNTEKVGEFTMTFVETPNMCEIRWIPDPNSKKYVLYGFTAPVLSKSIEISNGLSKIFSEISKFLLEVILYGFFPSDKTLSCFCYPLCLVEDILIHFLDSSKAKLDQSRPLDPPPTMLQTMLVPWPADWWDWDMMMVWAVGGISHSAHLESVKSP
ncbi:hypothetical protein HHK36_022868 [Tetracentron sinense]|uniref:SOSS complex subunit B homolog n=1 Tax=Tetracentron sinense TaxID=13715 RepID=A0A834YQS6_TETSI|nr:hypothetical protein HHK36_022868 [Tetracentron sinense]